MRKIQRLTALAVLGGFVASLAAPVAASAQGTVGPGTWQNDAPQLIYSGSSWQLARSSQDSGGSSAMTTRAGSVSLTFDGTAVAWEARTSPNSGISDVYIDGELRESVDRYSATGQYRQTVFSAYDLGAGPHTIEIRWTGARNPSATGSNLMVDAIVVLDVDPPIAPSAFSARLQPTGVGLSWNEVTDAASYVVVRSDDGGATWTDLVQLPRDTREYIDSAVRGESTIRYAVIAADESGNRSERSTEASVTTATGAGPGTYEENDARLSYSGSNWSRVPSSSDSGGASYVTSRSGSVFFAFEGTAIQWVSRLSPAGGIAQVSIDGNTVGSVDRYAAQTTYRQVVFERRDLDPGQHLLEIAWTNNHHADATGTTLVVDALVVPDVLAPAPPTNLSADIRGSSVALSWSGSADQDVTGYRVYRAVEDEPVRIGEVSAAETSFDDVTARANVAYRYTVTASDASGNESQPSEHASAAPGEPAGVGTYEQDSPYVTLLGSSWQRQSSYRDSNGSASFTTRAGSAVFTFTGTAVAWVSRTTPNSGINDVYIDGRRVARVDRYSASTEYAQTVFETYGLSDSTHTIEVRWTGLRSEQATGANLLVDAFRVIDVEPPDTPRGVTAAPARAWVDVAWSPVVDSDLEGYRVFRSISNGPQQDVSGLIADETFRDVGVPFGAIAKYHVVAYDATGNASARSVTRAVVAPSAPAIPRVRVTDCPAEATTIVRSASELTEALRTARPGNVIRLADGTYAGSFTMTRSGTPSAPIWICGGRGAVLTSESVAAGQGLFLAEVSYVRVAGFSVRNSLKGLTVAGGTSVSISDMAFSNIGYEAIHVRNFATNTAVVGNVIRTTGRLDAAFGEGIYIGTSGGNWCAMTGCRPDNVTGALIAFNNLAWTGAQPIELKEGTSAGVVYRNTIAGARGAGSASAWILVKGNDWVVDSNTGTTAEAQGYSVISADGFGLRNVLTRNTASGSSSAVAIWIHKLDAGTLVGCENSSSGFRGGLTNVSCQR